jgi:hypothetical protein
MPNMDFEEIRQKYKPARIRILLVGESPPPSRGFFYDVDAPETQLPRYPRLVFGDKLGRTEFLDVFRREGFYLVYLFSSRQKTVKNATSLEKKAAIARLIEYIQEADPQYLVSVLKRINPLVRSAMYQSGADVEYRCLRFPTRQYIQTYRNEFKTILTELGVNV